MKAEGIVLDIAHQVGGAEPETTTLKDWSGFGNDGTFTNGPTWAQLPSGLWVLVLDGDDDEAIKFDASPSLDITKAFTIESWIYPTVEDTNLYILGKEYSEENYQLIKNSSNGLNLTITRSEAKIVLNSDNDFTHNAWHYVVGTFDGSDLKVFVDGEQDGESNSPGDIDSDVAEPVWWGCRYETVNHFYGRLSHGLIRRLALSPAQIRARYHSTKWMFEL